MGVQLNPLAVNQIPKGTVIFTQDDAVTNVCLIVKGKVLIGSSGTKVIAGSGSFIGISDIYAGRVLSTYVAVEDLVLYAFPVSSIDELEKIYYANKDYRGLIVGSLSRYIVEYNKIYKELSKRTEVLYTSVSNINNKYMEIGNLSGKNIIPINNIEKLIPFESEFDYEPSKIAYYEDFIKISMDTLKAFYSSSINVTTYQVEDQAVLIGELVTECVERVLYIVDMVDLLINNTESCLFKGVAKLSIEITNKGQKSELLKLIEEIKNHIHATEKLFIEKVHLKLNTFNEYMEEIYSNLINGDNDQELSSQMQVKFSGKDAAVASAEMKDSLKQILEYSQIQEEEANTFVELITEFSKLNDKYSTDDKVRVLRKRISDIYYRIYENVFFRSYKEKSDIRIIDMFLNFGFLDETMLSKEQALELYYLTNSGTSDTCKVYTMKEWLTNIYDRKKEPSKNEFDMDYIENLRETKKSTKLTQEQEREYIENPRLRVDFEIMNMFRYNNRLVNGQVSTFVPFLYEDGIAKDIASVFVSTMKVNETVNELLKIDYSVFHREVLYYDEANGIKKEFIMEAVYPDIILFPMYGQRSIMWQEITGKKRNTPGRFLLPAFVDGGLDEHMIRLFGHFRWELCRCIQGAAWNDIKYKSLTSEYSDYIQFYRKNRELSEDKKEKLKAQIQKGRHNTREIFVIDYEVWMKSECNSALRLNKVARELLATYCPFSLEVRKRLGSQPMFEDAMARFNRNTAKKIKEIDLRIRALEKDNIKVPEVLLETQKFYRDL